MKAPKVLIIILASIAAIFTILLVAYPNKPGSKLQIENNISAPVVSDATSTPFLTINGKNIYLDVANTDPERTRGLSGRNSMPKDHGMLFIFDVPSKYGFWMYEMKFPLDFVWINGSTVVETNENVPAPVDGSSPAIIDPEYSVDKVLEVNAGTVKSDDIKIGDSVQFHF